MSQVRRFPLLLTGRCSHIQLGLFFKNFRRGWEGEGTSEEGGGLRSTHVHSLILSGQARNFK